MATDRGRKGRITITDPDTGKQIVRAEWIRRVFTDETHPLFQDRAAIARKLSEIEGRNIIFQTVYQATKNLGRKKQTKANKADYDTRRVPALVKRSDRSDPTLKAQGRTASLKRSTYETRISATINLDGSGHAEIQTGVGFLDHMLTLLAHHSLIDISLKAEGDLHVDDHHTVEDIGLVLGNLIRTALGDKRGIRRYASRALPMDETLVQAALDISGRPLLVFNVSFPASRIGSFDSELVEEWFRAFSVQAGLTLHMDKIRGSNGHHISEACFKALAQALREAIAIDRANQDRIPSSKGVL